MNKELCSLSWDVETLAGRLWIGTNNNRMENSCAEPLGTMWSSPPVLQIGKPRPPKVPFQSKVTETRVCSTWGWGLRSGCYRSTVVGDLLNSHEEPIQGQWHSLQVRSPVLPAHTPCPGCFLFQVMESEYFPQPWGRGPLLPQLQI